MITIEIDRMRIYNCHHDYIKRENNGLYSTKFDEWLLETYGFSFYFTLSNNTACITISNPSKKLLFDIKYP